MTPRATAPIGLMGGPSTPCHYGPRRAAAGGGAALGLGEVRRVPGGDPPHRAAPAASAEQRLAMLDLAVTEFPGLVVDPREIAREGKSYTVLTLEELRAEAPARPLVLIVGMDAFAGFPTWHRWHEVFTLAHVVVVTRPGAMSDDAIGGALRDEWDARASTDASKLESTPAGTIFVQSIRPQPISSTVIRRTLAHGHAGVAEVRGLLPPAVLAYIDRNQLYRPRTDAT